MRNAPSVALDGDDDASGEREHAHGHEDPWESLEQVTKRRGARAAVGACASFFLFEGSALQRFCGSWAVFRGLTY
jgi:hypothetical protein